MNKYHCEYVIPVPTIDVEDCRQLAGLTGLTVKKEILYYFNGNCKAYTFIAVLGYSSFQVHTFPEENIVWIDVISCKQFRASKLVEFIKQEYKVTPKVTCRLKQLK